MQPNDKTWPIPQGKASARGLSLIETLVSLGILGIVMIPMLFMTGAYFMGQLAKSRTNIDLAHNVAQLTNNMMEELSYSQQVLPISSVDALYLAYYDPMRQREIRHGYKLVSYNGEKILQKLVYNQSTDTWDVMSPYGTEPATSVMLPGTTSFTYCVDAYIPTCTAAASAREAVLVRLSNWSFSRGAQTYALPELDIYVATASTASNAGGTMLSDTPRQLYSVSANSFGAYNLALSFLSPDGLALESIIESYGTLSTILPADEVDPGEYSAKVAPDGRIYFGEYASGRFWTWKDNGTPAGILSTILPTNRYAPGNRSVAVGSDGRVFFGEEGGNAFWTWNTTTGLTTIGTFFSWPGGETSSARHSYDDSHSYAASAVGPDGRMFFAEMESSSYPAHVFTWHPTTGLTTIGVTGDHIGGSSLTVSPVDSRAYFGDVDTPGAFYTWKANGTAAGALTVIMPATNVDYPGLFSTAVAPDGRVYFGQWDGGGSGKFYTWKDNGTASGSYTTILPTVVQGIGYSVAVAPDGRVFFGEDRAPGSFWTWKETTGLTTIMSRAANNDYPGYQAVAVSPIDGRVYFGEFSSGDVFTWKDNGTAAGVLSTIMSGVYMWESITASPLDGRVYFGDDSLNGNFYTWKDNGTGAGILSTIATNRDYPGIFSTKAGPDGRVFFADSANPGMMWTWKDEGVSGKAYPILPQGEDHPGDDSLQIASSGRAYFGEWNTGRFWTWTDSGGVKSRTVRLSSEGLPLNQTFGFITTGTPTYVAATQDMKKDVYLVDSAGKTVDRYTLNITSNQYFKTGGFSWSANATSVKAVAVDNSNDKIALLDRGSRQIDVYANKIASGSPSTILNVNVAGQASNPTGLAISSRTGNMLVIDSNYYSSGGERYCDLEVYSETGTHLKSIPIMVSKNTVGSNLTANLSLDGDLKIQFDEQKNVLFLIAPNKGYVVALTMPDYL